MNNTDNRFKDAPWYDGAKNENIFFVGTGGIGSNAMYCLAKTIPAKYYIKDFDKVEVHNIGTQFFKSSQIGSSKVNSLAATLREYSPNVFIQTIHDKITVGEQLPITICGFDNMEARKMLFESWKNNGERELFIDGRLRASYYEIFTVLKGQEEEYEKYLFDDGDVDEGPCTFKQTAYFGMLIGARITNILVNYLTNKYTGEEICEVPFKISELGDIIHLSKETYNGIVEKNKVVESDLHTV